MVVATFRGRFEEYDGALIAGDDGSPRLEGSVEVDSLVVKDENLAAHLKSPDFFDSSNATPRSASAQRESTSARAASSRSRAS